MQLDICSMRKIFYALGAILMLAGCRAENIDQQEEFIRQVDDHISYDSFDLSSLMGYSSYATTKYKKEVGVFCSQYLGVQIIPTEVYIFKKAENIYAVVIYKKEHQQAIKFVILKKNIASWTECTTIGKVKSLEFHSH